MKRKIRVLFTKQSFPRKLGEVGMTLNWEFLFVLPINAWRWAMREEREQLWASLSMQHAHAANRNQFNPMHGAAAACQEPRSWEVLECLIGWFGSLMFLSSVELTLTHVGSHLEQQALSGVGKMRGSFFDLNFTSKEGLLSEWEQRKSPRSRYVIVDTGLINRRKIWALEWQRHARKSTT